MTDVEANEVAESKRRISELEQRAMAAWNKSDAKEALRIWDELLDHVAEYPDTERPRLERNRRFAIDKLNSTFSTYPWDQIQDICAVNNYSLDDFDITPKATVGVTLFILSCKRFDLFTRTINSFINHCTDRDLITRWICIDDNSHPTDRAILQALYPFFEFVWKTPEQAGQAVSMNIAQSMISTPFVVYLEDDWLFTRRMDYIGRSLAIFEREPSVKQVLFNRHYAEIPDDNYISQQGGVLKRDGSGRRYRVHEYHKFDSPEWRKYSETCSPNFAHQPHFAVWPSVMRREVWETCGRFNEADNAELENEYALKYVAAGFKSAYFDGIYCIHIGRLNRDKYNADAPPNAYQLNNKPWYGTQIKSTQMKTKGPEKVVLTVTTCKRLATFIPSICSFLSMCKDPWMIDRFIIVDDNSTQADCNAMTRAFPFFELMRKTPEQKGHARSMNVILDVDADYIVHTEDDWCMQTQFSISDSLHLLQHYDQVVLIPHKGCSGTIETLENTRIVPHVHNLANTYIPGFFQEHRALFPKVNDRALGDSQTGGCWWPGFSLNPAIWKAPLPNGLRFNEGISSTLFEYDMALRLDNAGYKVCCLADGKAKHATQVSAYVLNGDPRVFDALACGNHRSTRADPNCQACKQHNSGCLK